MSDWNLKKGKLNIYKEPIKEESVDMVSGNSVGVKSEEINKKEKSDSDDDDLNLESDEGVNFRNRCGLLQWRPEFMQVFRSIYAFLVTLCIVCIIQTALSAGYMSSQITTLERRFSLDSSMLGIIQSFFDVGFITAVIFVGYFGGQGRIPLWIAYGMLIVCLGAFSFTLPEFITNYINVARNGLLVSDTCNYQNVTSAIITCATENKANWLVKLFFIIGQIFIGCGSSPILSLAPTYIDDHVPPALAPPLIAMLYASSALGPVIGFVLGAIMLKYHVNLKPSLNSKPGDYNWIGAWWLGYLILGSMAVLTSFFLFMFPRRVRKIKRMKVKHLFTCGKKHRLSVKTKEVVVPESDPFVIVDQTNIPNNYLDLPKDHSMLTSEPSVQVSMETAADKYGKKFRDIPHAIWDLLTNKIYVVVSLAICFEMFLVNGFAAFLPKYIENEYKVSNITASLIAGGLIVPAGALGIIAGGMVMHRFQLSRRMGILFSIVAVILVLICMLLFFLFGCNNPYFSGINIPIYYKDQNYTEIDNLCNKETCKNKCDPNYYSPICNKKSGVTFFSGCFAGCEFSIINTDQQKLYYNCSCADFNSTTDSQVLTLGECALKCNALTSFVLLLTLALFLTGITQNPLLMVTIRSVKKHERSFALGFQFVILRILAYIPSPIIYGVAIDSSCVHWKWNCNDRGDCLVTDLRLLNFYLIGLSFAVKCGAAIFYVILYFIVPKHIHTDTNLNNSDIITIHRS